jgi:hypothetical protein
MLRLLMMMALRTENLAVLKRAYGAVVCKRNIYPSAHPGWEDEISPIID